MNLSNLSKEQKQLIVLGLIVGATLLYAGFRFGLQPMAAQWHSKRTELATMEGDLRKARRLIASRGHLETTLAESREQLRTAAEQYVPNQENPLSWATQKIYFQARSVGVDIEAVSEVGSATALRGLVDGGARHFASYAVRIVTACSYQKTKEFVRALQDSNPYLCVAGFHIGARSDAPELHTVTIDVEWPAWGKSEKVDQILAAKGA